MTPSEFWNLTITEWWWWFETMIPREVTDRKELLDKLHKAQAKEKNNG